MTAFLLPLLLLGSAAGFLAGLLGVGGGILLVPGLYYLFAAQGMDEAGIMHAAVGTSLAVIVPTGLSSARAHWKRGQVRPDLIRGIAPGILAGVAAGTMIAGEMSGETLKTLFAIALVLLAGAMFLDRPAETGVPETGSHPDFIAGTVIGCLSSLMGIGGATVSVPYMTLMRGASMHQAVGTAATLGLVIAVPAAIGFMLIGWNDAAQLPYSLGYVNIAGFAAIAPAAILVAPFGAKAAHALPVKRLRRVFAFFMIAVAIHMLYGSFHG